jgi:hypothetical protein
VPVARPIQAGLVLAFLLTTSAGMSERSGEMRGGDLNAIAEEYVKLVLAVGQHDPDYVDAYYGPPEWRPAKDAVPPPLGMLRERSAALSKRLASAPAQEEMLLRREHLAKQLGALDARLRFLGGERLTFDEESRALYDAVAPVHPASHFDEAVAALDRRLPGTGPVPARYERYRAQFVIPKDRLDRVFAAAIEGCRARTRAHVTLPADERFTLEYVTGKPWSGYNWYQGGSVSVIQINTDLPIYIDRAIDLACHEGYPGHHVYNALLEEHLVRRRGWVEFTVYPLFSPQSLIAEGTANFGVDVAFPRSERAAFEREHLFPSAGLDASNAAAYHEVQMLVDRLKYADNEAARGFLDGGWSRDEAIAWLQKYALMRRDRAEQRVRFIERYRSYVINYNLGEDLVRAHVEARGGTADHPEKRWEEFVTLISSPRLPSGLSGASPR